MGILLRKHAGEIHLTPIAKLSLAGSIISLASAFVNTIWAIYLDSFLHSTVAVGFFSTILTVISFISFFVFVPIIEKHNKVKIYSFALLSFILFYVLFSINTNFYFFIFLAIAMTLLATLRVTSYGLIIKDTSSKKSLTRNEGVVYTSLNISWVLGPLIAGFILSKFSVSIVFLVAAIVSLCGLLLFQVSHIHSSKGKTKVDKNIIRNFIDFFRDRDRTIAYILGGGVNLWWILSYLFVPLLIIRSGLSDVWVGYFLFAVALPLILLEYVFSKWANKHGFGKLFKIGYLGTALIAVTCFFVSDIYLILGLLAFASIFMAMLEPTTEAYFFDILKKREDHDRFYGPYNTAIDAGFLIAKLFSTILLVFLPFKFLFILFGALMFSLFLLSFKTKQIIESK